MRRFNFIEEQNGKRINADSTPNPNDVDTSNPVTRPVDSIHLHSYVKDKLAVFAHTVEYLWQLDQNNVGDVIEVENALLLDANGKKIAQVFSMDSKFIVATNDNNLQADIERAISGNTVSNRK